MNRTDWRRDPVCPGCDRMAQPGERRREPRWICRTPGCVVDNFVDSRNPIEAPRQGAMFAGGGR